MSRSEHLESVFRQLDYLDDAFEDGSVSHVGLRRIILETPELEAEIGSAFTRTLLNRAERNLYGRLSYQEFLQTYSDIIRYQMVTAGEPQAPASWTPKGQAHLPLLSSQFPRNGVSMAAAPCLFIGMAVDLGVAVYYRYWVHVETNTAYAAHLGGALIGLLLGIVILRNIRVRTWERVIWWMCLILVLGLFLVGIVWNAVNIGLYEEF
ncbi:Rhomboid-like protein [Caligus rogercresseyi]|uniref:Rhomboid-like protein n=1 Tax=Caligus rogercresseyi TaxID=217165 RepID=A0A7T8HFX7_CALRO|nr:Rhomboid-like protein [Caligus rogercresseyi]